MHNVLFTSGCMLDRSSAYLRMMMMMLKNANADKGALGRVI